MDETAKSGRPEGTWSDYLSMARPGHASKHVIIIAGVLMASIMSLQNVTLFFWGHNRILSLSPVP